MDKPELFKLLAFRHYQRSKEHPLKLDRALETETPGMTGFFTFVCFLVQEPKEAGRRHIHSCWKCFLRAYFVLPEHPEPRERANFAANGDRRNINLRLICTAPPQSLRCGAPALLGRPKNVVRIVMNRSKTRTKGE